MEFIPISENKIKIMLTREELADFELTAEELDYTTTETKRLFWDVLARAKRHTGFDTDGQRVLVQLYPSRDGGCELFVTKLGITSCEQESGQGCVLPQPREDKQAHRPCSFVFESLTDLLCACARLLDGPLPDKSSAYLSECGKCYLLLSDSRSEDLRVLSEYGRSVSIERLRLYLEEHGRPICRHDAVKTLGTLQR